MSNAEPASVNVEDAAVQEIFSRFEAAGQKHVFDHWDSLDDATRAGLLDQLEQIDVEGLAELFETREQETDWSALSDRMSPPPAIRLKSGHPQISELAAATVGEGLLSSGLLGVVIVAGGQGSRLGFHHPKGMFEIAPLSGATLFQILFEKALAVARRHSTSIPLYVMTSPATHDETVEFLNDNAFFQYPEEDVQIFCQGVMPAVDAETGKLLMSAPGSLCLSPDGHGGLLAALKKSGAVADMNRRGLTQLFYHQIDNLLVNVLDPAFIGYHVMSCSDVSTQVVAKAEPHDRVGNVVMVDGKLHIIEYSDIPDEIAETTNDEGQLVYWAGNMAVHALSVAFMEDVIAQELPFHFASKKVSHLDADGQSVTPEEPNAIKFERFIFDILPMARQGIVVEVDEDSTYAPLKNETGQHSPDYVRDRMMALHRRWIRQAGVEIDDSVRVEISPLFARSAQELANKLDIDHIASDVIFRE